MDKCMNYEIIKDKNIFNYYIDNVLPDLESGETFYVRLITRSKYVNTVKFDNDIKSYHVDKNNLFNSIKQLECEIGSYNNLDNNSICVYLNPNPRSYKNFMRKTVLDFTKIIAGDNEMPSYYEIINPIELAYKNLRSSCSRKVYFDIDFDKCDRELTKNNVSSFINKDCIKMIMPTKGGIHFLLEISKIDNINYKDWYKNISKLNGFDFIVSEIGDNMIPIPGCSQFGFVPYFDKF